jgi:hypothetical protein
MTISIAFDKAGKIQIGLLSPSSVGSLFFGIGTILDIFYSAGKLELVSIVLHMCRTQGRQNQFQKFKRDPIQPYSIQFNAIDGPVNLH